MNTTVDGQSTTASIASVLRSAREAGGVGVPANVSVRELGRRSGVSAGQISRIENGQVVRPRPEVLIALARALNRNPMPLMIVAGYVDGEEARDALRHLFRSGAELPAEWGEWALIPLDDVLARLAGSELPDDRWLGVVAADAFAVQESDETLWKDGYEAFLARGDDAAHLRELVSIWQTLGSRREELLQYARSLGALSDLEYEIERDMHVARAQSRRERA